jgi:threonine synthase
MEIVRQLDWEVPEWIIIPGGNLGNVSALAKGFDMMIELGLIDKRPRICVGQAEAANPLYLSYLKDFRTFEPIAARTTVASAIQIGNPVSRDKAIDALRRYDGVVEQASESEILEACAAADRTGLFNCPHTGVALVAMRKLVDRGLIDSGDRVVVVSTAHGLKFTDFKLAYHEMRLDGIAPDNPNPPIELPARYADVRDRMLQEIDLRFRA